mgnify:CR=1 FL=1
MVRLLSWLVSLVPETWVMPLAGLLARLPLRKKVVRNNLNQAFPEMGAKERRALGAQSRKHLIATMHGDEAGDQF